MNKILNKIRFALISLILLGISLYGQHPPSGPIRHSAEMVIFDNLNNAIYTKVTTDSGENLVFEDRTKKSSESIFVKDLAKQKILLVLMETGYDEVTKRIIFNNAVTDYEQLAVFHNWLSFRVASDWGQRGNLVLNNFNIAKRPLSNKILIIIAEYEKIDVLTMTKGDPKSLKKVKSIGLTYHNLSLDLQKNILRLTPIRTNMGEAVEVAW